MEGARNVRRGPTANGIAIMKICVQCRPAIAAGLGGTTVAGRHRTRTKHWIFTFLLVRTYIFLEENNEDVLTIFLHTNVVTGGATGAGRRWSANPSMWRRAHGGWSAKTAMSGRSHPSG